MSSAAFCRGLSYRRSWGRDCCTAFRCGGARIIITRHDLALQPWGGVYSACCTAYARNGGVKPTDRRVAVTIHLPPSHLACSGPFSFLGKMKAAGKGSGGDSKRHCCSLMRNKRCHGSTKHTPTHASLSACRPWSCKVSFFKHCVPYPEHAVSSSLVSCCYVRGCRTLDGVWHPSWLDQGPWEYDLAGI